jgi:hypothetical protein
LLEFCIKADFYDVNDGYLDLHSDEETVCATFCPGFWKAIVKVED